MSESSGYLGKKGYTVHKSQLNDKQIEEIKNELTLKPVTPGQRYGQATAESFPVYRENANKMYVPRFYGEQRFGAPTKTETSPGEDVQLEFTKQLRDYQEEIIKVYMDHVQNGSGGGILEVPCGKGKTVMALKIICNIQKKTLILVHKEFLMNQWIERIEEFVPSARVGKIQAQICDVEDKDIVIGMIQTMYTKTYEQSIYDQFGLTIIDEVHRIGSEEFSKTLLKTITPYMLGISATVERKDKLTKLLYMFIGPKIYSEKREGEDEVTVRAINYHSLDDGFNTVDVDYRGQTKYSTMIRKLCEYGPRSDFIVRIIKDLIEENPAGQIMILAHNKSLLKYIFEKVTHMEIATAGYYIGGMKQKALQETETKQIVIATYAMAAEALDIKSLSRLIMATPKSDITQSVGRILRMKHDNPIIVDICDSHDCFQNQWYQRRRFYKQNKYKMVRINSENYNTDFDSWRVI